MRKWALITPHQGLGDHVLCTGIYREYARKYGRVLITVSRKYYPELKALLGDLRNITFVVLPTNHLLRSTMLAQNIARLIRIRVVGLGGYGPNFLVSDMRFDQNFYDQAEIDFGCRWTSFFTVRNLEKEEKLFKLFKCNESPYIFIHEDTSRGFEIDRRLLPKDIKIIQPLADTAIFNLVDYRKVIEGATEIHVIESSFAAYIEGINTSMPLFAHRYARPETFKDYRHEFTYKKQWEVYT